jgi:hypothetical protein
LWHWDLNRPACSTPAAGAHVHDGKPVTVINIVQQLLHNSEVGFLLIRRPTARMVDREHKVSRRSSLDRRLGN